VPQCEPRQKTSGPLARALLHHDLQQRPAAACRNRAPRRRQRNPPAHKHDGLRVIARKDGDRLRLYSRPGNDMTRRFPLIAEALTGLRSRSCIIDGEAVACDDNGVASFDLIRNHRANDSVFLYTFDLIELNG